MSQSRYRPVPSLAGIPAAEFNPLAKEQTRLAIAAYWEARRRLDEAIRLRDDADKQLTNLGGFVEPQDRPERDRWHKWCDVAWDARSKAEEHVKRALFAWDDRLRSLLHLKHDDYKPIPRGVVCDGWLFFAVPDEDDPGGENSYTRLVVVEAANVVDVTSEGGVD